MELSFKAVLEVLGKLAATDGAKSQPWQTHDLVDLFNLLTDCEQSQLERWWSNSDTKKQHFDGTFREFLSSCKNQYAKWRYITDLRSADLSIDIRMLLSGASFLLSASENLWQQRSPIKVEGTVATYSEAVDASGEPIPPVSHALVRGRVRSVHILEGFDPHSLVEVIIASDRHGHDVTALFHKRNVSDYFGIEGKEVELTGYAREDQPHLLQSPQPLDHLENLPKDPSYTSEHRTLRGSVYDLRA